MSLSNGIEMVVIDEQVVVEGGLLFVGGNAGGETGMGGLDIAIAMVDAEDNCVVIHR